MAYWLAPGITQLVRTTVSEMALKQASRRFDRETYIDARQRLDRLKHHTGTQDICPEDADDPSQAEFAARLLALQRRIDRLHQ